MRKMGALRDKLPRTHMTYLFGTLAIAGIFPFAGFFSKDEILFYAFSKNEGFLDYWGNRRNHDVILYV